MSFIQTEDSLAAGVSRGTALQGLIYGTIGIDLADENCRATNCVHESVWAYTVLTGDPKRLWLGFLPIRRARSVAALVVFGEEPLKIHFRLYLEPGSSGVSRLIDGLKDMGYDVEVDECPLPDLVPEEKLNWWSTIFPFA